MLFVLLDDRIHPCEGPSRVLGEFHVKYPDLEILSPKDGPFGKRARKMLWKSRDALPKAVFNLRTDYGSFLHFC
jgi:hypothetical protein